MQTYKIIEQKEYTASDMCCEDQALGGLGGCADTGEDYGLGVYQYSFVVDVTVSDETRRFNVDFQPRERNNGMEAYSGYEMATAGQYGCDSDQSSELLEFCDYDADILESLHEIAEKAAKAELERLLEEMEEGIAGYKRR